MQSQEVIERFKRTGALLEGHFVLTSGLHSAQYLQCALVLQYPDEAQTFGRAIAEGLRNQLNIAQVDAIASPAIGGLIIGHETARALKARAIFTERAAGRMTLRRGFKLKAGERVVVIEDVMTTGGSTRETIEALREHGAQIIAAASIIDRSAGRADVGVPRIALAALDVPAFEPKNCPNCLRGEPAIKPGSRERQKNSGE